MILALVIQVKNINIVMEKFNNIKNFLTIIIKTLYKNMNINTKNITNDNRFSLSFK